MSIPVSRVKVERLRKLEKQRAREELRAKLPVLTRDDIRKFRLPYYQAIQEELNEKGFVSSAEFIRQLLDYQTSYQKQHAYDFVVQARPLLIESTENLERLAVGLKSAEEAHYGGDTNKELDALLTLAYFYGFGSSDWWWLADQLFEQCLQISLDYTDDFGFREAECKYVYGKYLIDQDLDVQRGLEVLETARMLSEGSVWTASKLTQKEEKTIFLEVCTLIYSTLVKQIKVMYRWHPDEALELCAIARRRGVEACIPKAGLTFLQGKCEMEANKPRRAVDSFRKAQLMYNNEGLIPESCEARICLALAYLELGEWEKTCKELQKLLEFATENDMQKYVGLAHTYIGLYYLNQGTPESATPILEMAMNIFHELNDVANREFAKNLACISKGQETIAKYTDLILRCETADPEKNRRNMMRLIHWKDLRTSFTDDMSVSSRSLGRGEEDSTAEESVEGPEALEEESFVFEDDEEEEEERVSEDREILIVNATT